MDYEKTLEEKLRDVPSYIREQVFREATIDKICEAMKNTKNLQSAIPEGPHKGIEFFNPYKPLIIFTYLLPYDLVSKKPNEELERTELYLNYFDCLDLIEFQARTLKKKNSLLKKTGA